MTRKIFLKTASIFWVSKTQKIGGTGLLWCYSLIGWWELLALWANLSLSMFGLVSISMLPFDLMVTLLKYNNNDNVMGGQLAVCLRLVKEWPMVHIAAPFITALFWSLPSVRDQGTGVGAMRITQKNNLARRWDNKIKIWDNFRRELKGRAICDKAKADNSNFLTLWTIL